ncbi:excinuclease ABC subunit C, partial [bacterium]|nr:excinuclease ABC subunit C [bacterium]
RFSKPDPPPPDLLLIDGGKGQLASAEKALEELGIEIPILALAKSRTQSAFTRKAVEKSEERIFIPDRKNPIVLREAHPALRLLQQVRDEAHRFSVESHRKRRTKEMLEDSQILDLPGLGKAARKKLLSHFGSLEAIASASFDSLVDAGLTRTQAETVQTKLGLEKKLSEEE